MDARRCLWVLFAFCMGHLAWAGDVGYRRIEVQDTTGEQFPAVVWYPTAAAASDITVGPYTMRVARAAPPADGSFGLIVISHGSGGNGLGYRNLAMALASRGYVVAAPTHPGDNVQDTSGVGAVRVWAGRPRQVSRTIDRLLADEALGAHLDRARIGVAGHSAGGYTALALAGAQPRMDALVEHCIEVPADARLCSFGGPRARQASLAGGEIPDVHDERVRAVMVMAPVAALFTDEALARIAIPVRVYGAELDDLTPVQFHASRVAKAPRAEYVIVKGAGHYSFVTSFPATIKERVGEAAADPAGFDRDAMQAAINPEIAAFFDRTLTRR